MLEQDDDGQDQRVIHYGLLQAILECVFPPEPRWKALGGTTLLLALIVPCKTKGDASTAVICYKHTLAEVVVDIRTIQAVVGRVQSRKNWGIIDRHNGLARTMFVNEDDALASGDDDE